MTSRCHWHWNEKTHPWNDLNLTMGAQSQEAEGRHLCMSTVAVLYIDWFIQEWEATLIRILKYTAIWCYSQCYSPSLVCFRGIVTRVMPHIWTNICIYFANLLATLINTRRVLRILSEFQIFSFITFASIFAYVWEGGGEYFSHRAIYLFPFVCGDIFTSLPCIFFCLQIWIPN